MNPFFIIILCAILLEFILQLVANLLNLRSLKYDLPPSLGGMYQPEEYGKSQEYSRSNTKFSIITGFFRLGVLLVFWFAGGFNYLDEIVRSWEFIPVVNGLLYIAILLSAYTLITMPFGIYETFVLEERFGFNTTTWRIYISDRIKGLVLTVLLGVPLLLGILSLFEYAGAYAWLYCWAGVVVISLLLQLIIPTWIMPLFNKFTPLESGELKDAIFSYAGSVNFPIKNIFVIDSSKRSGKSNAFFTGFGRSRRIALFDTLIEKHTVPELVAILAHEIGHYKKKHILINMLVSIAHTGVMLFLLSLFINNAGLHDAFYMTDTSVYTSLIFFSLLYTPVELLLSIVMQIISRKHEYQADSFAADTVGETGNLVSALKKLHADNLSNMTPHPFYVFLNYSHPPLLQRLKGIEKIEK